MNERPLKRSDGFQYLYQNKVIAPRLADGKYTAKLKPAPPFSETIVQLFSSAFHEPKKSANLNRLLQVERIIIIFIQKKLKKLTNKRIFEVCVIMHA